jgi:hypothetical protein
MRGGLVVRGQNGPGEPGHRLAVRGQRHGPGVAHEQRPADGLLELADVLAHRRLPDAEPYGRLGEAQRLRHGQEGPQLFGVVGRHRGTLIVISNDSNTIHSLSASLSGPEA